MRSPASLLVLSLIIAILPATASRATNATVKDGGIIQLDGVTYRLDGIDPPALDQICIDEHADAWTCGVDARDRLTKLLGDRQLRCDDLGADPAYGKRHLGVCTVEGETASLNQLMVRNGFALGLDPQGKFRSEEIAAKDDRRGLWKGCFVAPQDFRRWRKDAALLGGSCRADRDRQIREVLFPADPGMPSGCSIKGKYAMRARVTGNVGIYHLQACRSYPGLTKLVLFRGRGPGRRVPQSLQLPGNSQEEMTWQMSAGKIVLACGKVPAKGPT
jgi:endonuclease YncB( thermonuclease family)